MRLASYLRSGRASYGAVVGNGIVDLGSRLEDRYPSLRELIARGGLDEAAQAARRVTPDLALDDTEFLPPVPSPEKIICVGVNYLDRNEEYRDGSELPRYPSIFMRTPGSVVGHQQPIVRPPESAQLDYEGEIAIVIGKAGRRIAPDDAPAHIAGLTCMNEGTVRDWLRHGKFNVTQGKNFDRTGSIGPWLVTADGFSGYDNLTVTTRVNGEVRQHESTARLLFSFPFLIHYISTWTTLRAGDVIATGTPTGAGARFDPPRYLRPGDRVEVEVSGVGTLVNPVVDEEAGGGGERDDRAGAASVGASGSAGPEVHRGIGTLPGQHGRRANPRDGRERRRRRSRHRIVRQRTPARHDQPRRRGPDHPAHGP